MNVLVVDIGGTSIKVLVTGRRRPRQRPSGDQLTPQAMIEAVRAATSDWPFDVVSIGYPGPVRDNRPEKEPVNLGAGWKGFDFAAAFGRPVWMINDAAMQAIGSYRGGRMLFLGLGTGLGTTLVLDGTIVPLELAHLPYRDARSFEEIVGDDGRREQGLRQWRRDVTRVVGLLLAATVADYAVLGGGNVRHLTTLPPRSRRGNNANAFRGGFRLWEEEFAWA